GRLFGDGDPGAALPASRREVQVRHRTHSGGHARHALGLVRAAIRTEAAAALRHDGGGALRAGGAHGHRRPRHSHLRRCRVPATAEPRRNLRDRGKRAVRGRPAWRDDCRPTRRAAGGPPATFGGARRTRRRSRTLSSSPAMRISRITAQALAVAAVLWFAGRALTRQWHDVARVVAHLHIEWALVIAAAVIVVASYLLLIELWRVLLHASGHPVPFGAAARVWFVSSLGRYVPGKVWQLGAMGVMLQKFGVPVATSTAVALVN